jgi:hypothetical protein
MLLTLPQRNATLVGIGGGGTSEDYDSPAGADTPTWEGEADAWVHDSTRQASDLSGGLNLVKTTYVVLPGELSRYLSNGDTITFEHESGELSSRDVREIDGPYNPNGWPYSTMRVWLAPE